VASRNTSERLQLVPETLLHEPTTTAAEVSYTRPPQPLTHALVPSCKVSVRPSADTAATLAPLLQYGSG